MRVLYSAARGLSTTFCDPGGLFSLRRVSLGGKESMLRQGHPSPSKKTSPRGEKVLDSPLAWCRIWTENDEIDLPKVPMLRETVGVSFHVRGRHGRRVVDVKAPNFFGGLRKLYHEVNAKEHGWEILGYQMRMPCRTRKSRPGTARRPSARAAAEILGSRLPRTTAGATPRER
jgi:hypothetical protein